MPILNDPPSYPEAVRRLPGWLREKWAAVYAEHAQEQDGVAIKLAWAAVRTASDEREKARKEGKMADPQTESKSLNLIDWQMFVAKAFESQFPAVYAGPVFDDHVIAYAQEGPQCWKVGYTLQREAVSDGETETITGVTFAPQVEWVQVVPVYAAMKLFEQEDGRIRWLAVSSGGFEDWDGEVVSTAFLEDCVQRADKMNDHGELWVAHVPGTRIGGCDFQGLSDGFLLESGLLDDTPMGERAKSYLVEHPDTEVSITFAYRNRSQDGVYSPPGFIIERSILPAGAAAFPWSSISLMEMDKMATLTEPKRKALEEILGEEVTGEVLAGMERGAKALAAAGVRYKELSASAAEERAAEADEPEQPGEGVLLETVQEFELSEAALDGIAEKLWQRQGASLEANITPLLDQVGKLRAVVEAMGADVARLTEAEDERLAEKAANLPRATVRRIVRPTQAQEKALAEPDGKQKADTLVNTGLRTLYGD